MQHGVIVFSKPACQNPPIRVRNHFKLGAMGGDSNRAINVRWGVESVNTMFRSVMKQNLEGLGLVHEDDVQSPEIPVQRLHSLL